MSNYWNMREGKVNIAHALMNRGWKIYGYYPDESDSMTDYWSPALWDGIATKNGFILVVDKSTGSEQKEIKQYNSQGNLSASDREKITKLEQMTIERGCTPDEANTAKKLIEDIQSKIIESEKYIVTGIIPAHMANPGKCKWHIEKDGKIYDKGTGITKYADIPKYGFNLVSEKYEGSYQYCTEWEWIDGENVPKRVERTLSEEQQKAVTDLKALILRFERVVNGMSGCGDGTAETEAKATEQAVNDSSPMEKIIEKVTKKVIIPIEKTDNTINIGDVLSFSYHGHYWIVTDIWNNNKGVPCATYELLGSAKRGYRRLNGTSVKRYYQPMPRLEKEITEGKTKVYTLQEVEEVTEVEKWIRKKNNKQSKGNKQKQESNKTDNQTTITINDYEIKEDIDTRDNSKIYVVKLLKSLSRDEYLEANQYMRSIGGYYSKFKHGFIFKSDPTSILTNGKTGSIDKKKSITDKEENEKKQQEAKQTKRQQLADKINKQIESAQSKIDALSGDYKTNTYKRMNEQANREAKKERYQLDIDILQYLADQLAERDLTLFEENLIISIFRNTIHLHYKQHEYYLKAVKENQNSTLKDIKFPEKNLEYDSDNWWNKEVPKKQKQLNRAGINNTDELIKAVEQYEIIYKIASKPIDRTAQQIKKLENEYKMQQKGDINFTPTAVVKKLIDIADIGCNSRVLEPSAGIGNIADAIKQITNNVDVIERMSGFRELLQLKGHNLVGYDFLEYETKQLYDAIIMNPPFSAEQEHIKHAYSLLKDGGTLVSITSPSWTFNSNKKSVEFREWIENENSYTIDLPSGTFEMTGVASKILVIEKPEQTASKTA